MLNTASEHDAWRDPVLYPIVARIRKRSEAVEIAVIVT
jgi:hypothetical protein